MVLVAYERAGCDLQLGPSQSFVDWSAAAAPAIDVAPEPPVPATSVAPELSAMMSGGVQSLALFAMLLVSLLVGALGGAASAIGSPELAGVQARAQLVALADGLREDPAALAEAEADVERTLASVQASLAPVSPVSPISEVALNLW